MRISTLSGAGAAAAATIVGWRDRFLAGGQSAVKSREPDERDNEITPMKAKIGEITMESELLRERAQREEADHAFAQRSSKA